MRPFGKLNEFNVPLHMHIIIAKGYYSSCIPQNPKRMYFETISQTSQEHCIIFFYNLKLSSWQLQV